MFQRRKPLPVFHRLRELLWPRRGWRRSTIYIAHRLSRLPGTPYRIAAGFACGSAISFTPFIGLHFLGAVLLSLVLRGNLLASAIGTVVGNPWTFPFIWAWIYGFGRWLLGIDGAYHSTENLTLQFIFENLWSVFWPMTVGGLPTAVVAWFVSFMPIYSVVQQYQKARQWRIRRKASRLGRHAEAGGLAEGNMGKQS